MIKVSAAAAAEIRAAAERSDAGDLALRIAARQVADGTIEYGMGFDEQREDDESVTFDGVTVLVGAPSRPLLNGARLDYVEIEPGRFDFIFAAAPDEIVAADAGLGAAAARTCGSSGCNDCS